MEPTPKHRTPEERVDRLVDTFALVGRLGAELGPSFDLDAVLAIALGAMRKLVDFRGGSIQFVDERGIYIAAADPAVSAEVAAARLPVGEGLSGRIVATGLPIESPDLDNDERVDPALRRLGSNAGMRSYIGVPMLCLGETIGVMQVDSPHANAFDEDDLLLLSGLAAQVAGAIESVRRFEQIMELERLKSDFIGRVSHELRTPITIIDGFLSTVLAHGESFDDKTRRRMLERSQAAVSRLGTLIEELITLARLETGLMAAHRVDVRLARVLLDVRDRSVRPEAVTVVCDDEVMIVTDESLLGRAIGFIVDNAIKYGGQAELAASDDGRVITVRDEGPGLPDDVRANAFELFTRSGRTTAVPGLGLGLPVARTLLDVLGASIRIDVGAGGGTEVVIHLS